MKNKRMIKQEDLVALSNIVEDKRSKKILIDTYNLLKLYDGKYLTKKVKKELESIGYEYKEEYLKSTQSQDMGTKSRQLDIVDEKILRIGLGREKRYTCRWLQIDLVLKETLQDELVVYNNEFYDIYYNKNVSIEKLSRETCNMIWKYIEISKAKEITMEFYKFLEKANKNDEFVLFDETNNRYYFNIQILAMSKLGYLAKKGYLKPKEFEFFNYGII